MSETQTTFTYTNPRYFDGDPFEVARQAVEQAEEAVRLAVRAVTDANVLARNAELERMLYAAPKDVPDASGWGESAQGRSFRKVEDLLSSGYKSLGALRSAAGFNPRHPPTVQDS